MNDLWATCVEVLSMIKSHLDKSAQIPPVPSINHEPVSSILNIIMVPSVC